jgi:hypothetical protein
VPSLSSNQNSAKGNVTFSTLEITRRAIWGCKDRQGPLATLRELGRLGHLEHLGYLRALGGAWGALGVLGGAWGRLGALGSAWGIRGHIHNTSFPS